MLALVLILFSTAFAQLPPFLHKGTAPEWTNWKLGSWKDDGQRVFAHNLTEESSIDNPAEHAGISGWMNRDSQRVLWPLGSSGFYEVPFVIKEGDFTPWMIENIIIWAMRNIERGSNIRFRPVGTSDVNYLVFLSGEGCLSIVGRHPRPRPQRISLNVYGCMYRHAALHEVLHSLGLYHEHQRVDAVDHVEMSEDAPPFWDEYVHVDPTIPIHETPYNLASVMHYNLFLKAKNPAFQSVLDTKGVTLASCDWYHLNTLYPGPVPAPPCVQHQHMKACEPLISCPYGSTLCKYMCEMDCDAGLPRGDIPGLHSPAPFCRFVGGKEFPPMPALLEEQVALLRQKTII